MQGLDPAGKHLRCFSNGRDIPVENDFVNPGFMGDEREKDQLWLKLTQLEIPNRGSSWQCHHWPVCGLVGPRDPWPSLAGRSCRRQRRWRFSEQQPLWRRDSLRYQLLKKRIESVLGIVCDNWWVGGRRRIIQSYREQLRKGVRNRKK